MTAPIVTDLSRQPFDAARYITWLTLFDVALDPWTANGIKPSNVNGDLWQRIAEGKRRD